MVACSRTSEMLLVKANLGEVAGHVPGEGRIKEVH